MKSTKGLVKGTSFLTATSFGKNRSHKQIFKYQGEQTDLNGVQHIAVSGLVLQIEDLEAVEEVSMRRFKTMTGYQKIADVELADEQDKMLYKKIQPLLSQGLKVLKEQSKRRTAK